MATKVGEIEVAVIARLDKLEKDLNTVKKKSLEAEDTAKGSMQRVSSAASAMGKKLLLAGGAFATIAGVRGMGRAIKSSIDFADNLGKTASKLGVTTDFLQEMRFAADQSGVSINTADMALQRFARRAAEAAVGTGEAKGALEQMRIELRDGEGQLRSTEVLFSDAMKALGDIEDPAERLRLAFKLFDSEGAALVNMAEGFKELQIQAREMGIVLDESAIKKAEAAKGKIDALSMVTQNELNAALIDLAPLLVDAGGAMAWMAKQAGNGYSSILNWAQVIGLMERDLSQWAPTEEFKRSSPSGDSAGDKSAIERRKNFLKKLERLEIENAEDAVALSEWERDQKLEHAKELFEAQEIGLFEWGRYQIAIAEEHSREVASINEKAADDFSSGWKDSTEEVRNDWEGLTDYMSDSFKDALATMIIDGEISFKQLGEAFLREFIQRAISSPVDNVFGLLEKGFNSLAGSAMGYTSGNLTFSDMGGANPTLGNTIPIDSLPIYDPGRRSSAAGVSVNVINASGEKSETSETQNADGTRQIEVMIGKSVSADIYRGGPIDSAIRNSYGIKRPGTHGV